ncbi:putative receptor-like protein kinase [Cardamine amara subsp. amara]|uniref:Receptor-like protein kinase n=1 Tax=Cardamine amara subsp. amara TaxID=228776 RepID=A0ABD1AVD8_CARAN
MFRRWLPDDEFLLSENSGVERNAQDVKINYTEKTPAYVAPEDVYTTSCSMGNNAELNLNSNLTWLFTVDAGFNYLVRLHFCETLPEPEVTKPGQRIFSIFIGNLIASLSTDVIQLSGGSRIPVYLDFSINEGLQSGLRSDLRLDFRPYKEDNPKYYDAILNGVEILNLNDIGGSFAGRIPNPLISPAPLISQDLTPNRVTPSIGKGKLHVQVIILITVGSAIGLATFIVVLRFSMRQMKRKNREENGVVIFKVLLKQYTYAELKKITKSFSYTVGKGGFGTVYEGNLIDTEF